jgi:hypothetical protein
METAKYLCEFFFNDFWHFVMLLLVCYTLSPKINNSNESVNIANEKTEEDKDE